MVVNGGGGMAVGIAIGVAIGAGTDNIGAGIAVGVAIGAALEAGQRKRRKSKETDEDRGSPRPPE